MQKFNVLTISPTDQDLQRIITAWDRDGCDLIQMAAIPVTGGPARMTLVFRQRPELTTK